MKILIIEDEKITRISLSNTLRKEGFEVYSAEDGEEGLNIYKKEYPEIVITDLRLPKISGIDILTYIKSQPNNCNVILITAHATVETAVQALKLGAYDYLTKPFSLEKLISILRNIRKLYEVIDENKELKNRLDLLENRTIVGNSPSMKKLKESINLIAQNDYTVLIEGESGTGKEMVARALHEASNRNKNNFIAVNCAIIPENLIESELFGHEKGAFTGAIKRHEGYFERANKGTIFLDDIDDFPLPLQVKLLRVLQEREFTRIGGNETIKIDIRVICATKINLKEKVDKKLFREDLYYRMNIIPIKIPPLRERKEDIPVLIEHFFKKHGASDKINLLNNDIISKLMEYNWPGNVRELENIVERMIALSFSGKIDSSIFDFHHSEKTFTLNTQNEYPPYEEFMLEKEKEIITWALKKSNNNISQAAKLLKIPRSTLSSKLEKINDFLKY
ncbi:MAG TPA: sigma-54 dependent transcriptional regulator [Bacteroidota bacterium]|jgi:two-component system response regulator AtoC|nr:sigma-54 dependent transcriptional regulator [Bacteroidota bacterium]